MFSKFTPSARDLSHKLELRKIGSKLRQLIQRNDEESQAAALQIIEKHQGDSEVINAQVLHQSTPLILASELGQTNIAAKLLAAKSIDVNRKGHRSKHALEAALQSRKFDAALLLINDDRVNINAVGASKIHPVFIAMQESMNCPFTVIKALLSRKDLDLTSKYFCLTNLTDIYDYHSRNILHGLVCTLHRIKTNEMKAKRHDDKENIEKEAQNYQDGIDLLKSLLAAAVIDIDAFKVDAYPNGTREVATALMLAVTFYLPEAAALLLAAGADPDLDNDNHISAANKAQILSFDKTHGDQGREIARQMIKMIQEEKSRRSLKVAAMSMFGTLNDIPDAAEPYKTKLSR